jgi:tRNA pseudouridine32 synthase / 23S rRNA pseudouridine746 synthase
MEPNYNPPQDPIPILFVDEHILVVEKPAGLLSVPGKGEDLADCLIERLRATHPGVLLVHRLDRDTSGVMIFALTPEAQKFLGQEFENRLTKKVYIARVQGEMSAREGTVDQPIKVDWPNRPLQHIHPDGRPAVTDWRVIRVGSGETLVRLYPKTGRSHQLRVHMAFLGHPILGDPFYAHGAAREFPRLMLHSESLKVRHPESRAGMVFSAKAPFVSGV